MPLALRLLVLFASFASGLACAQAAAEAGAKPRVHALVAAVGNRFHVIHEEPSTGSHLSPFKRRTVEVPGNTLNRLVLKSLDASIAKTEPGSERVFVAMSPPAGRDGPPRGDALLDWIVAELEKMPERARWDRILVATPAHRAAARERLPNRLEGMGVFAQNLCQGDPESCDRGWTPSIGAEALTPEGEKIQANHFVAPYSFIEVWVLDPKTLAVLGRGQSLDHTKMFDPKSDALNVMNSVTEDVLAARIVTLVERSVTAAVADTERRGSVDVRMRKEVKP